MTDKKLEKFIEEVFEEPAKILEDGVDFIKKEEEILVNKEPFKTAKEYWNTIGPGLITGAADDDPSGIATYSQTGAQFGPKFLWLSLFSWPLASTVQEMCARIGLVTGHGLAANIRKHYPRWALYLITGLLFFANTLNIGADLGAMAEAVRLISPNMSIPFLVIAFGVISILLQVYTTYARYAQYLKYLSFTLLAYIFGAMVIDLDWNQVLFHTIIPTFDFTREQIFIICAVLGTTISPYLFFWQTSQEVEEQNLAGNENERKWKQDINPLTIKHMKKDVWTGMFFSESIMFFIIATCAGTLYVNGITNINTASDAANALRPFAGDFAFYLFAIGIVGIGMLAIPVLAGATSYAISESFGLKHGLYRELKEARAFYGVIIVSVILGIIINFIGIDPMKALIYSAVANGLVAPVAIFFIVRLSSNKSVMGEYVNKKRITFIGWLTLSLMGIAGILTLVFSIF